MSFFGNAFKGILDVVTLPVAVVKDAVTLGGSITDKREPYTVSKLKQAQDSFSNAYDEID